MKKKTIFSLQFFQVNTCADSSVPISPSYAQHALDPTQPFPPSRRLAAPQQLLLLLLSHHSHQANYFVALGVCSAWKERERKESTGFL